MMTAEPEELTIPEEKPKKKGLLGRLVRRKKKAAPPRDQTPSPIPKEDRDEAVSPGSTLNSSPAASIQSDPAEEVKAVKTNKQVRFPVHDALKQHKYENREIQLEKPPTAREAAFGGPPRYDWIDIETAAAIKVQSVFRRNKTMAELEKQGITTAAIRNRTRRRQARMDARGKAVGSADIPNLFACCGVGLAFGDATEEDYEATRQFQREKYLERKKEKEQHEADLRRQYRKQAAKNFAGRGNDVEEAYEVVEETEE